MFPITTLDVQHLATINAVLKTELENAIPNRAWARLLTQALAAVDAARDQAHGL